MAKLGSFRLGQTTLAGKLISQYDLVEEIDLVLPSNATAKNMIEGIVIYCKGNPKNINEYFSGIRKFNNKILDENINIFDKTQYDFTESIYIKRATQFNFAETLTLFNQPNTFDLSENANIYKSYYAGHFPILTQIFDSQLWSYSSGTKSRTFTATKDFVNAVEIKVNAMDYGFDGDNITVTLNGVSKIATSPGGEYTGWLKVTFDSPIRVNKNQNYTLSAINGAGKAYDTITGELLCKIYESDDKYGYCLSEFINIQGGNFKNLTETLDIFLNNKIDITENLTIQKNNLRNLDEKLTLKIGKNIHLPEILSITYDGVLSITESINIYKHHYNLEETISIKRLDLQGILLYDDAQHTQLIDNNTQAFIYDFNNISEEDNIFDFYILNAKLFPLTNLWVGIDYNYPKLKYGEDMVFISKDAQNWFTQDIAIGTVFPGISSIPFYVKIKPFYGVDIENGLQINFRIYKR